MAKIFTQPATGFNPFGELVGISFIKTETAAIRAVLTVREELYNPNGVVHGGAIYSLADTAMAAALHDYLEAEQLCTTIELKINYFRPVTQGILYCDSKVIHKGKRTAVLEAEIRNGEQLVAKALGTFAIF